MNNDQDQRFELLRICLDLIPSYLAANYSPREAKAEALRVFQESQAVYQGSQKVDDDWADCAKPIEPRCT